MKRILDSVRSVFRRGDDDGDRRAVPRVVVAAPARLLASITRDGEKVIASTVNVRVAGLALAVPPLDRPISKDDRLQITLDLHPLGTVELFGLVRRVEDAEYGGRPGQVLAVTIVEIGHLERALYLEYIGTRGREKVLAGDRQQQGAPESSKATP